jgi:hypothetical protein
MFDATKYKPIEDMLKSIQHAYKIFTSIVKTTYTWNHPVKRKLINCLDDFSSGIDRNVHNFIQHIFADEDGFKKGHLIKAKRRVKAKKDRASEGETGEPCVPLVTRLVSL